MKIKSTVDILYAHPVPSRAHVKLVKGEEFEVDKVMGDSIIEESYGVEVVDSGKSLKDMTVAQLKKFAGDNEIEIEPGMLKDEILFFIEEELKER